MSKKVISLILIVLGGIFMILCLVADLIGIGSYPGINWAQIVGALAGLAVLVFGLCFGYRKADKKEQ